MSLGGVDSLAQHPASLTHRPVAAAAKPGGGIVRISIGLEHVDDLWADLAQALEALRKARREEGRRLRTLLERQLAEVARFAVEARATLGEISDTLRGVFGEHRELLV